MLLEGGLSARFIGCLEGHGSWKDVVLGTTVGLGRTYSNPRFPSKINCEYLAGAPDCTVGRGVKGFVRRVRGRFYCLIRKNLPRGALFLQLRTYTFSHVCTFPPIQTSIYT